MFVHIVWATRRREPLLEPVLDSRVCGILGRKALEVGCHVLAAGCATTEDVPTDAGNGDSGPTDSGMPGALVPVDIQGEVLLANGYPGQILPLFRSEIGSSSALGRVELFARAEHEPAQRDDVARAQHGGQRLDVSGGQTEPALVGVGLIVLTVVALQFLFDRTRRGGGGGAVRCPRRPAALRRRAGRPGTGRA